MDILFKPIKKNIDFSLEGLSLSTPIIDVIGYKPKYAKKKEETSSNPTESVVDNAATQTNVNNSQETLVSSESSLPTFTPQSTTSQSFASKDEFKSIMTPIYQKLLIEKGLNPEYARMLVAQDGLESGWGKHTQGRYNLGNITLGSNKTRSFTVGRDHDASGNPIEQKFVNYDSLEDYANAKIDLLNSERYRAFTGDISQFAERVKKGGYATDPDYVHKLNQVIRYSKLGGILKFQNGGIQEIAKEEIDWLKNYYYQRKDKIKENIRSNQKIPFPITESLAYNILSKNIDLTSIKNNPDRVPENAIGVYYPLGRRIYVRENSPSTVLHELVHSSVPTWQIKEIDKIKNMLGDAIYDRKSVTPDSYLDSSEEIYSRLIQLKRDLGYPPTKEMTPEEVEKLKRDHIL